MLVGFATPCVAQHAATIQVLHDDDDGLVEPGQRVGLRVRMDWAPTAVLFYIGGDVRATPNVGQTTNNALGFTVQPGPGNILDPGVASGASVLGVEVLSGWQPTFGATPPVDPWSFGTDFPLLAFEWTAPNEPGAVVSFDWIARPVIPGTPQPASPSFWVYPSALLQPVPTTCFGTTLTVVPAPGALMVLGAGAACRRRRVWSA